MINIYVDIETIPGTPTPQEHKLYDLWQKRYCKDLDKYDSELDHWNAKAPLFAEFGKIVCISVGTTNRQRKLKVKSYTGTEKEIVEGFNYMLNNIKDFRQYRLIGHNIKGFDIPFIVKASLYNKVPANLGLRVAGRKPREILHIDTMELLRIGGGQSVSLEVACRSLGIEVKTKGDGGDVFDMDIEDIVEYCEEDVRATCKLYGELLTYCYITPL